MNTKSVLNNWNIEEVKSIKQVNTGLLNSTFIVRTESRVYVLQKLHPAVSLPGCILNYKNVTDYLANQKGSITQKFIKTKNNKLFFEELKGKTKSKWRLLEGVEGNVHTHTKNPLLAYEAGKLLSLFHSNLKDYKKQLAKTLPMFKYDKVLKKSKAHSNKLVASTDTSLRQMVKIVLADLPKLMLPKDLPTHIVHTDPKISNFLFNNSNKGICMIDLDTIQSNSLLYDIGDALRSLCGLEEDNPNNKLNKKLYDNFIAGYLSNKKHLLSAQEIKLIPQACKLVTLGLATRFLNDYIDDSYFGWDKTKYKSRKEHNKARALGQLSLYQSIDKVLAKKK